MGWVLWMAAPAPGRLEAAGPFARAGVPVSRSASLRAEFGRRAPKASVSSFSFRRSALIRASRAVCVSRVTIRVQTGIDSVSPSVSPIARTVCSKLNRAAEVIPFADLDLRGEARWRSHLAAGAAAQVDDQYH